MESLLENLPMILAVLLGISEALAHIPALESNSILQLAMKALRKAKELFPAKKEEKELEEPKDAE